MFSAIVSAEHRKALALFTILADGAAPRPCSDGNLTFDLRRFDPNEGGYFFVQQPHDLFIFFLQNFSDPAFLHVQCLRRLALAA